MTPGSGTRILICRPFIRSGHAGWVLIREEAVCDPFGRVYGLDNVFVADGSIFPTSLGVNPQITIMAAASKISEYIHREWLV
jgi:choline dehydrogenase-like flavoprotein